MARLQQRKKQGTVNYDSKSQIQHDKKVGCKAACRVTY